MSDIPLPDDPQMSLLGDPLAAESVPGSERRLRQVGTNRARRAIKAAQAAQRTSLERAADHLNGMVSSPAFLTVHIVWFAVWIAWNSGALGLPKFDPYPFGFLTMVVSLEAIFLSIFVLMSQARESYIAELREEFSLQVVLRMEAEITKTLQLVAGLYTRLGHRVGQDPELSAMLQPLDADSIEEELLAQLRAVREERWQAMLRSRRS